MSAAGRKKIAAAQASSAAIAGLRMCFAGAK